MENRESQELLTAVEHQQCGDDGGGGTSKQNEALIPPGACLEGSQQHRLQQPTAVTRGGRGLLKRLNGFRSELARGGARRRRVARAEGSEQIECTVDEGDSD